MLHAVFAGGWNQVLDASASAADNPQQDGGEEPPAAGPLHTSMEARRRHISQAEDIRLAVALPDVELASLAAGHARSLKRRTSEGAEAREEHVDSPAPSADCLKGAIATSLRTFGEHMDARIQALAEHTEAAGNWLDDHIGRVDHMDRQWHDYASQTNRPLHRHDEALQNMVSTTEVRSELESSRVGGRGQLQSARESQARGTVGSAS